MICKDKGLIVGGSCSSAVARSISIPVSRFFTCNSLLDQFNIRFTFLREIGSFPPNKFSTKEQPNPTHLKKNANEGKGEVFRIGKAKLTEKGHGWLSTLPSKL